MAPGKSKWWGQPTLFSLFGAAADLEPVQKPAVRPQHPGSSQPNASATSEPAEHSGNNKQLRLDFPTGAAANQNGISSQKPTTTGTAPKPHAPHSKPPQQKRLFDLFLKPLIAPKPQPLSSEEGAIGRGIKVPQQSAIPTADSTVRSENANAPPPANATGDQAKALELIDAIRTLKTLEAQQRPATAEEQQTLSKFGGFGALALPIFPNPATGQYKSTSWRRLGEELQSLLTPEEYASAKRTTFNAFYTSPVVIQAMHLALAQMGIPAKVTILEPGCGIGRFLAYGQQGQQFIRIELARSPAASPKPWIPNTTSGSRILVTQSCRKARSTRSTAAFHSPI
ncbi:hypothetical protein [Planctomicrobium sp. SH664]|uniref:hypothetical protein n=1 Tax=Planctomicrobium sp. SH664 TaxID=3448125 RepID=UPI003F5BE45B